MQKTIANIIKNPPKDLLKYINANLKHFRTSILLLSMISIISLIFPSINILSFNKSIFIISLNLHKHFAVKSVRLSPWYSHP